MATESQFDLWRKDALGNLRKAGEAFQERAIDDGDIPPGDMRPLDRAEFCLAAAELTGQIMISERLGQLVTMLSMSGDERLAAQAERIRTGEQVLQRIVDTAEKSDLDIEDELIVSVTMAEDWLDPESMVNFASPESVEKGRDQQSKEYADQEEHEEVDPQEDLEEPFDRAEEDMREDKEETEFDDHADQDLPEDVK